MAANHPRTVPGGEVMATKTGPNLAEIYAVLNQLVDSYQSVMITFQTVITEQGEIKTKVEDLYQFVHGQFAEAVTARDIWRHNAETYKAEVDRLKQLLREGGSVPTVSGDGR